MSRFDAVPPGRELRFVPPGHHLLLGAGSLLVRAYSRSVGGPAGWKHFRTSGPSPTGSFDHHDGGRAKGVLYAARTVTTCLGLTFQSTGVLHRSAPDLWLACFRLHRPVRLLDLSGDWPERAGATAALATGAASLTQAWSRSIHAAYPDVEGLWYRGPLDGRPIVALYERASTALPQEPEIDLPLSHLGLLPDLLQAADELGFLVA